MNEDIEVFLDSSTGGNYLESLAKTRAILKDTAFISSLDELLKLELELALMGAQKAKSEILKASSKDSTVRPIK